ncbi:Rhophilin, Rho GTPase binding protein [Homalodisca vitripennis]|nr:Rhophilin, Rho GTPase binding protein [Homalodisca vitripennis]
MLHCSKGKISSLDESAQAFLRIDLTAAFTGSNRKNYRWLSAFASSVPNCLSANTWPAALATPRLQTAHVSFAVVCPRNSYGQYRCYGCIISWPVQLDIRAEITLRQKLIRASDKWQRPQSAGIFSHLKGTVMAALQQDPTPDLNPDTLAALSSLMLAQAQEIFVHKAIHDNMKEAITAKLANQAEELYADALKLMQKDNVRPLWDKEWLPTVAGKQAMFHGMAEFYQSLVCRTNKAIGEEITRLQSALEFLKAAQTRSGKPNLASDLVTKAHRHLTEAIKDNDFIYHERIPDPKSLQPIGRAPLAKALPVPPRLSSNFKDLFEQLVPMAVHQAMTAYENRKNELVNSEVAKLRDATQLLNSVLASLNLPAALEDSTGQALPKSLVDKATAVQELGGINTINTMLRELPELLTRNREILDESYNLLPDELKSRNNHDLRLHLKKWLAQYLFCPVGEFLSWRYFDRYI